jgi:hypothetical protein
MEKGTLRGSTTLAFNTHWGLGPEAFGQLVTLEVEIGLLNWYSWMILWILCAQDDFTIRDQKLKQKN